MESRPLAGRCIAIPETREAEVFAALLERRGARVIRCPLVAIRDAPDPQPILEWSRRLARGEFDDVVLLTGEGLRRIVDCLERHEPDGRERFLQGLASVRKITRGPKPAKALRELGLRPDLAAQVPTSDGIIAELRAESLRGRRVAVQLYGTEPNRRLIDFLEAAGATVSTVAPYVYAGAADDRMVLDLIEQVGAGAVDAVAFTSTPQVERLFEVAAADTIRAALRRTVVAAVGPVVAQTLSRHGVTARLMPEEAFFLKPLTSVLEDALGAKP